MRIAVALEGTDRGRSGISTFVRAILPRLSARLAAAGGSLVAFGARPDLDAYAAELPLAETVEISRSGGSPGASALWHLLRAGPLAARLGADVLLLPAANRRVTLRSPVPTVAVVHDLAQLRVPGKFDWLRMIYGRNLLPFALGRATSLIAVSEATRKDLCQALACDRGRVRVVQNGVDAARFTPPAANDERVRLARAANQIEGPYLLYPARLEHPGKNHLRLLRAFAASPARRTHRLLLAGADFGAGPALRQEIARLALTERAFVLGYVPDALLPGLVAGADAVVMVGLYEGFGLPALEALAAGRPVVAANAGALPEVTGTLAALCDPLSVASIGAALERALGDAVLRERSLNEGPAWAAARSWEKTAEGLFAACSAARGGALPLQSETPAVSA